MQFSASILQYRLIAIPIHSHTGGGAFTGGYSMHPIYFCPKIILDNIKKELSCTAVTKNENWSDTMNAMHAFPKPHPGTSFHAWVHRLGLDI